MGELIDLEAYRRRKLGGLPRLAASRHTDGRESPRSPDSPRSGLPKQPDCPNDPDAPGSA